ncbi:MAG: tyrosine-type recombinase/integrase [Planctomycetes bacterium]|nr:tyrosine-type recombinase/integrase [Planctomycetota bacterium]
MAQQQKKRRRSTPPGMLRHSSGQARVVLDGKVHYLGKWGTPGAHARYADLIQRWQDGELVTTAPVDATAPRKTTISGVTLAYDEWIERTRLYRKNGRPTTQLGLIRRALKELNHFVGDVPATKFTSALLIAHRDNLREKEGLSIQGINRKVGLIKQMVAWAAERALMPETNAALIRAVRPLRGAVQRRRKPVPLEDLKKAIPFLVPVIADMTRLQYLLACRPGEVCQMRWEDIDVPEDSAMPWRYRVAGAKTEHHGCEVVYFAHESAKEILRRHMRLPKQGFVFRTSRRECYTTKDYTRSLRRAARQAEVSEFTAHQIRHLALTTIANDPRGGHAAASAAANHSSRSMTDQYVHNDVKLAAEATKLLSLEAESAG